MAPRRGYQIIGSWNRWERFQILLDGDARRVLYPSYDRMDQATKGAPVAGPEEVFHSDSWMIDVRPFFAQEGAIVAADSTDQLSSQDAGKPGDRFKVRLAVKGKWRMVDWENLDAGSKEAKPFPTGTYQICGSWNHAEPQDMTEDKSVPGLFSAEVKFISQGVNAFQIIRNRDWLQAIYPEEQFASSTAHITGPDESMDYMWAIEGDRGDIFQVNFQREVEGSSDTKKVTWSLLRNEELTKAEFDRSKQPMYFAVGTWNDMAFPSRMYWTGEYYQFFVQLGARVQESFQILLNGNAFQCIYPDTPNAHPSDSPELKGPDRLSAGLMWTIGANEADEASLASVTRSDCESARTTPRPRWTGSR